MVLAVVAGLILSSTTALARAPSGAVFTTLPDGSQVNANIFEYEWDVYLDGGPGPNAPADAAGLPAGEYVFQVTDPSGKTLLSLDPPECRLFYVDESGLISGVGDPGGCGHSTGYDVDHGAATVQLGPFDPTPNAGGGLQGVGHALGAVRPGGREVSWLHVLGLQDRRVQGSLSGGVTRRGLESVPRRGRREGGPSFYEGSASAARRAGQDRPRIRATASPAAATQ